MTIRTKLTLIFFLLVIFIVSIVSVSIYYFSSNYRQGDFHRRLKNRAINTAVLLIEYDQIDAEILKKMERENPASLPRQLVKIYDADNTELFSLDEDRIVQVDSGFLARIRNEKEITFSEKEFEILAFVYSSRGKEMVIVAGATDLHGLNALKNLRTIILITFMLSIVVVSVIGWIYSGRVLKPISRIVSEVDNISEANLNARLNEGNRKDELSKLAQTFNRMLSRLESAFNSQKSFIANASHELKTPFTVMAGEIEVTLLHPRNKEYYIKILESVLQSIRRFNKLSTQLLLLAQTSTDHPQKRFSLLRIDDILWEAKNELEKMHPEYIVDIEFDLDVNQSFLLVEGDDQLLQVAMTNLMDNGCKYSNNDTVVVSLFSGKERSISIQFINSGDGIQPEELDQIFNPFYRGANRRKTKGFGIGLSLSDRIVKLHDGRTFVESHPHNFTKFVVELPIARAKSL